jgi:hypothetical protein
VHRHRAADLRSKIWHGITDRERSARGALGVVAVGDWRAEHRHDAVADVLVDAAAEALDNAVDAGEEPLEHGMNVLGVQLLAEAGVADQVAEQDGHLPPLACGRRPGTRRRACEPVPAGSAVLMVGLHGEATGRAALRQPGTAAGAEPGAFRIAKTPVAATHRWPHA